MAAYVEPTHYAERIDLDAAGAVSHGPDLYDAGPSCPCGFVA